MVNQDPNLIRANAPEEHIDRRPSSTEVNKPSTAARQMRKARLVPRSPSRERRESNAKEEKRRKLTPVVKCRPPVEADNLTEQEPLSAEVSDTSVSSYPSSLVLEHETSNSSISKQSSLMSDCSVQSSTSKELISREVSQGSLASDIINIKSQESITGLKPLSQCTSAKSRCRSAPTSRNAESSMSRYSTATPRIDFNRFETPNLLLDEGLAEEFTNLLSEVKRFRDDPENNGAPFPEQNFSFPKLDIENKDSGYDTANQFRDSSNDDGDSYAECELRLRSGFPPESRNSESGKPGRYRIKSAIYRSEIRYPGEEKNVQSRSRYLQPYFTKKRGETMHYTELKSPLSHLRKFNILAVINEND